MKWLLFVLGIVVPVVGLSETNIICSSEIFEDADMYILLSSTERIDENGDYIYNRYTSISPIEDYAYDERIYVDPETGEEPFILFCNHDRKYSFPMIYEYGAGSFTWTPKNNN